MDEKLKFYCLNVRGAGNKTKRQSIFSWLKSKGTGIIFLQECHNGLLPKDTWRKEWDGDIYFCHG